MIKKCEWCQSSFELGEEVFDDEKEKEFSKGGYYSPECEYFCCNEHFNLFFESKMSELHNEEDLRKGN